MSCVRGIIIKDGYVVLGLGEVVSVGGHVLCAILLTTKLTFDDYDSRFLRSVGPCSDCSPRGAFNVRSGLSLCVRGICCGCFCGSNVAPPRSCNLSNG